MRRYLSVSNKKNIFISIFLGLFGWNTIFWIGLFPYRTLAAESEIINQAEATYQDNIDPNRHLSVTSNQIKIKLAEIAGITIIPTGIEQHHLSNPTQIVPVDIARPGEVLYYNFEVANIGNDPTKLFIPNVATIVGAARITEIQYLDGAIWKVIPSAGLTSASKATNEKILVRVLVKLDDNSSGTIEVSLGKTGATHQQNIERIADNEDVYTVDNTNAEIAVIPTEVAGVPTNGTREASASQKLKVGERIEAFARVLETIGNVDTVAKKVTYNLSVDVAAAVPAGVMETVANDLVGTNINGLGRGILVSQAIPLGTQLEKAIAPDNWRIVYLTGNPISETDTALSGTWTDTLPADITQVRRVGFFADTRIERGTNISGFHVTVAAKDTDIDSILSISQLFGAGALDPNNIKDLTPNVRRLVVDESGDKSYSNYQDDHRPPLVDTTGNILIHPGIIDPQSSVNSILNPIAVGKDNNSNNTGIGSNGEYLEILFAPRLALLNGPLNAPAAIDKNNNNDFTNLSTIPVEAINKINDNNVSFNPANVIFSNTVRNDSSRTQGIKVYPRLLDLNRIKSTRKSSTIKIAQANNSNPDFAILPEGTTIRLRRDDSDIGVNYIVKDSKIVPVDPTKPFILLPQVASGTNRNYLVDLDLPDGTSVYRDYAIELMAFIDVNDNGILDGDEPNNITIDRTYTGFLRVVKLSRLLDSSGTPLPGLDGEFNTAPKTGLPGQIVEYIITYENISLPVVPQSGSRGLTVTKFQILEDGNIRNSSPNNWASLSSHVPGSAAASPPTGTTARIVFNNGDRQNSDVDVSQYINTVTGSIAPQQSGSFSFRRRIN